MSGPHCQVFLDTCVMQHYNFNFFSGPLGTLRKYADEGAIVLCTHEIVERECSAHVREAFDNEFECIRGAVRRLSKFGVLSDEWKVQLEKDRAMALKKWEGIRSEYFRDAVRIPMDTVSINEIFDDYFERRAPFESRRDKKHEFPDAVIIASLCTYAAKIETPLLVISKDKGWAKAFTEAGGITLFQDIPEAVDFMSSGNGAYREVLEYLRKNHCALKSRIWELLDNASEMEKQHDDMISVIENGQQMFGDPGCGVLVTDSDCPEVTDCRLEQPCIYVDEGSAVADIAFMAHSQMCFEYVDLRAAIHDWEDDVWHGDSGTGTARSEICGSAKITLRKEADGYWTHSATDIGDPLVWFESGDVELTEDCPWVVDSE